jgi:hypothetical protein
MLPLLFPSDPRLLSALPGRSSSILDGYGDDRLDAQLQGQTQTQADNPRAMEWRSRNKKLRQVELDTLRWVDGVRPTSRWTRPADLDDIDDEMDHDMEIEKRFPESDDSQSPSTLPPFDAITPLTRTRKPSARKRTSEG